MTMNGSMVDMLGLRQAVSEGLLYTHTRLDANQRKTVEAASFLYALVELLSEKGLITIGELDARKEVVAQRHDQVEMDAIASTSDRVRGRAATAWAP